MLNNFCPKLPFPAKVFEVVVGQLIDHLNDKGIFDKFQSGFRAGHSTETALLRVLDDLLLAEDNGLRSVFLLLDLTAAFDTVDHVILIERLKFGVGISGTALYLIFDFSGLSSGPFTLFHLHVASRPHVL